MLEATGVRARILRHVAALLVVFALTAHAAQAQERFTPDDVLDAINLASADSGVSYEWLRRVIACETGQTYNPYVVGKQGELGPAQLHPRGLLPEFYKAGYTDPVDPYQALTFTAQRFLRGDAYKWTCR